MYEGIAEAYLFDRPVQDFIQHNNPWALRDMAERLLEANQRGLWQTAPQSTLDQLAGISAGGRRRDRKSAFRDAMKRVLILGGTGDAIALAAQAAQIPDLEAITSLAGRTQQPAMPIGLVRVGGFGGAAGLADYLRDRQIDAIIDATHPFAAQITWECGGGSDRSKYSSPNVHPSRLGKN